MKTFKESIKLTGIIQIFYLALFVSFYVIFKDHRIYADIISTLIILITIPFYFVKASELKKDKKMNMKLFHFYSFILWIVFSIIGMLISSHLETLLGFEHLGLFDSHEGIISAIVGIFAYPLILLSELPVLSYIFLPLTVLLIFPSFTNIGIIYIPVIFTAIHVLIIGLIIKLIKKLLHPKKGKK